MGYNEHLEQRIPRTHFGPRANDHLENDTYDQQQNVEIGFVCLFVCLNVDYKESEDGSPRPKRERSRNLSWEVSMYSLLIGSFLKYSSITSKK